MNDSLLNIIKGYNTQQNDLMSQRTPTTTTPIHNEPLRGILPILPTQDGATGGIEPKTLAAMAEKERFAVTEPCEGTLCLDFEDPAWYSNFSGNSTMGTSWILHSNSQTETNGGEEDTTSPNTNYYVLVLSVIVLAGVMGNLLVCIAITIERKLQNVTNYFLLSLSIADLFVCFFVMPCSIVNELMGKLMKASLTFFYYSKCNFPNNHCDGD